jgi:DNA-binding transcriptional LysR family regulator
VPKTHPLAKRKKVSAEELKRETMLLLGTGHCFRDHVLEVCPEFARFSSDAEGIKQEFRGQSLETIKHMVASGMGVTVVPAAVSAARTAAAPGVHAVRTAGADAPGGAGVAPQFHALRGHRSAAQCGLRLRPDGNATRFPDTGVRPRLSADLAVTIEWFVSIALTRISVQVPSPQLHSPMACIRRR